jgi:hypothetical protein
MGQATLRVGFERAGSEDRGEMAFTGSAEFISQSVAPLSYLISTLQASYGADKENWLKAGNELMAAWEAAKKGESYKGEIVSVTILPGE